MTDSVAAQTPVTEHVGNGVTTSFAYTFTILDSADLVVELGGVVQGSGFTVSGVGVLAGGAVLFTSAPASGVSVLLRRSTDLSRSTAYTYAGDLREAVVDADFNRLWHAMQERAEVEGRALRAPVGETLGTLPAADDRASTILGFDSVGGRALYPIDGITTVPVADWAYISPSDADITNQLVATAEAGRVILLGDGVYPISPAAWPGTVRIIGAGAGKSILRWVVGSGDSHLISLSGVVSFRAEGVTFDGQQQLQTDGSGYYGSVGGVLSNGSRVVCERCEFINGRISDLYFTGPSAAGEFARVELDTCTFSDGLVGSASRAAQAVGLSEGIRLTATGNKFRQPSAPASYGRGGIVMQRPAGSTSLSWGRYIAIGNEFDNFGRGTLNALGCLYVYSGSEQTVIDVNVFRNSYGTAATVKADGGSAVISNNSIYGNIADNSYAAISVFGQADTYSSSSGRDLVISGNTIRGADYTSIFVDGGRPGGLDDFDNVEICGNVCDGAGVSVRGIHFRNVEAIKISDNLIRSTTGIGVFGEDCSGDVVISDNTISTGLVGVDILGSTATAKVRISDNTLTGMTASVVRLRSAVLSFHITGNNISGGTTAYQTSGATELSTILGNTVTGAAGWVRSGTYGRTIHADGTDYRITPQDFGAVGNNVVDDSSAVSEAVAAADAAGSVLDWGVGTYKLTAAVSHTFTKPMRWVSSGAKIVFTPASAAQAAFALKLPTGDNYLKGPLTVDANNMAYQGFRLEPVVQGTHVPDLVMEDTTVLNWYRSGTTYSGGDAIYTVGTFGRIHLVRPKCVGGRMAVGAGVSGSEGIFGITCMRTTSSSNQCPEYVSIVDPWVENIWSEDAAWVVDQDAIRVFTRYGGGGTSGYNNPNSVDIGGGRIINIRGRSIKLQTESGRISGVKLYRTTLANAGTAGKRTASADIDAQTGGCVISDIEFNYVDYSHYCLIRSVQAEEGVPYGLPHAISNIIASIAGAYAPTYGFLIEANSGTGLTQTFTTVMNNVNVNNETAITYGIYVSAAEATTNNVLLASNLQMKLGTALLRYVSATGHTADARIVNAYQNGSSVPLLSGGAAGLTATGLNIVNLT